MSMQYQSLTIVGYVNYGFLILLISLYVESILQSEKTEQKYEKKNKSENRNDHFHENLKVRIFSLIK